MKQSEKGLMFSHQIKSVTSHERFSNYNSRFKIILILTIQPGLREPLYATYKTEL